MIKWIALAVTSVIALLALIVVVAGSRAPVRHVARVSTFLKTSPSEVWRVLSDIGAWPAWNKSIEKIERAPDINGHPVWAMTWNGDVMPSEIVNAVAPTSTSAGSLVTRIADDELPFGGTWTWELVEENGGTRVAITEDGFIKNVIFRGVSSLFIGYTGTQRAYLTALSTHFGHGAPTLAEDVTFPE